MNNKEDESLLLAVKGGDPLAFAALVHHYEKPIFNVVFRMLHDTEEARDVTQTVFLKTYENLHSYDPERKFFSWIYRVAINEAINCQSRSKPESEFDEQRMPGGDNPGEALAQAELQKGLEAALMKLTTEYRSIVVLKHIVGMNYHEISASLEIPEKTVKSRLFSARRQMREYMKRGAYL